MVKRYEVRGNADKLFGIDIIESDDGEWVKWEDVKYMQESDDYNPNDFPEVTQEEHEALHQESLSEGN